MTNGLRFDTVMWKLTDHKFSVTKNYTIISNSNATRLDLKIRTLEEHNKRLRTVGPNESIKQQ